MGRSCKCMCLPVPMASGFFTSKISEERGLNFQRSPEPNKPQPTRISSNTHGNTKFKPQSSVSHSGPGSNMGGDKDRERDIDRDRDHGRDREHGRERERRRSRSRSRDRRDRSRDRRDRDSRSPRRARDDRHRRDDGRDRYQERDKGRPPPAEHPRMAGVLHGLHGMHAWRTPCCVTICALPLC